MDEQTLAALARLIRGQRAASLGSLLADGAGPYVSLAPYAAAHDFGLFFVHLSRLAVHTRNLQADPRAALMIAEADTGAGDPQTLARVSLQVTARPLARDSAGYTEARGRYTARFPASAPIFDLADFDLYELVPAEGRFVAAFGRIFNLTADHLRQAAAH
jgi:putative heme iron utilization protein